MGRSDPEEEVDALLLGVGVRGIVTRTTPVENSIPMTPQEEIKALQEYVTALEVVLSGTGFYETDSAHQDDLLQKRFKAFGPPPNLTPAQVRGNKAMNAVLAKHDSKGIV